MTPDLPRGQNGRRDLRTRPPPAHQRRPAHAAGRRRPGRDPGVAGVARRGDRPGRAVPRQVPDAQPAAAGQGAGRRRAVAHHDGLHQHDHPGAGALVPRRRVGGAPDPRVLPLERRDHGAPRPAPRGRGRRPHLDLRLVGLPVRGGLQPLLPRQGPPRRRRPDLLPGACVARHVRPGVPRGAAEHRPAGRFPAGAVAPGRRALLVPAPAADAGLLGVPDGVDGPRAAERDLPGAVQQVPERPRHQGHLGPARVGVPRRRRDGRGRVRRRDRAGRPRGARQPDVRRQLQPAAARRPGARQRQDHPGARGAVPRRRLERHQGGLGPQLGPAARRRHRRRPGQHHEHHAGRRLPDLQGRERRLHPRALLRPRPAHPQDGRGLDRRGDLGAAARRPRLPQALRGVQGGDRAHRPADRDPRQDHQGLDPRQPLRGPQRDAPDEEAVARRPQGVPRPAADPDQRRAARREAAAVLPPGRRLRRHPLPARAAAGPRRLPAGAPHRRQGADPAGRRPVRGAPAWLGQADGRHDDGLRAAAQGAAQGPGDRRAVRPDHPGRGAHVRDGLAVPDAEDLQPARAALPVGRPRARAVLQGVRDRA